MHVNLLYFGVLKEMFGGERDAVELPEGARIADLLDLLRLRPRFHPNAFQSLAVAVNREYAQSHTALADGDEVALLPPVSGGREAGNEPMNAH